MKIYKNLAEITEKIENVVLTIGNFDGVHIGHQRIIRKLMSKAKDIGGQGAVMLFEPHPRSFFSPDSPQKLLTTVDQRLQLLEELGVDIAIIHSFDTPFASIEPLEFIENILVAKVGVKHLHVSSKFRFGNQAAGSVTTLQQYADQFGYSLHVEDNISFRHLIVSSTFIRNAITDGEMEIARFMLGRPYVIDGIVYSDTQRGSSLLDTPTCNIVPDNDLLPAHGIYAGIAILEEKTKYAAATYVGTRPSFDGNKTVFETHLIGYSGDLYGKHLTVEMYRKTRPDKKFTDLQDLSRQIKVDIEDSLAFFRRHAEEEFMNDVKLPEV